MLQAIKQQILRNVPPLVLLQWFSNFDITDP